MKKAFERIRKNPACGRHWISQPIRIVTAIPKKTLQNLPKNNFFLRQFYTLYKQKFSNLSNTFPQGFQKSNKFGHWTLGSGGKKTFNCSEQMQKNLLKRFFCRSNLDCFWTRNFKSETTSVYYFSPRIQNISKVWTLEFRKGGGEDV